MSSEERKVAQPIASTSSIPYSSISSSSVLNLKAQLSEQQDQFNKTRHLGTTITGIQRSKPSGIFKQNKGVKRRADHDERQFEAEDAVSGNGHRDPKRAMAALERKAKVYDKIKRGKTGGLNSDQIDNLLVDFDRKRSRRDSDSGTSDSEDEDESATVPDRHLGDDSSDPMVDFTDEFGRTRSIRRSELPRGHAMPVVPPSQPQYDPNVMYGDQSHFPVYAPDPALLAARAAAYAASASPLSGAHYDARNENRSKAAGFYQFSGDEETRQRQMEALKGEREHTERAQAEVRESAVVAVESEKEKRKRKIEEKRKEGERKRLVKEMEKAKS